MTFKNSIKNCIKNYVNIQGRASRSEFWWWYLFQVTVGFVCGFIGGIFVGITGNPWIGTIVTWIVTLVLLCPSVCVQIRRYHDINRSGWWILCPIMNIVFCFFKGDRGENEYGLPEQVEV